MTKKFKIVIIVNKQEKLTQIKQKTAQIKAFLLNFCSVF